MQRLIKTTKSKIFGGALSNKFLSDVCSKLEIQYKRDMYVSSDFGWYSIHFDIVR